MTLEKTLDVLRNKELSFGCYVRVLHKCNHHNEAVFGIYISHTVVKADHNGNDTIVRLFVNGKFCIVWSTKMQVLLNNYGHPLTAGRIRKLGHDKFLEEGGNVINSMQCIMLDLYSYGISDKTELERMQHEKWSELYPLLVEFSNYFK